MKRVKNRTNTYQSGTHNVTCDRSGFVYKRDECLYTWDGLLVHESEWEPKHPQIDVRPPTERVAVKDARPQSENDADLPSV